MRFIWPISLLLLGLIPVIIGMYIWALHRRRRYAVRFSSLALVRDAVPRRSSFRRHIPFALFLFGLTSLFIALGRPVTSVSVPTARTTIILAIDVSRSMCASDIAPNRLRAAKDAAMQFIARQEKDNFPIGIVAFAGFAAVVQSPTIDQEALQDAVENLSTARRTAIGSAILKSLDAIAEIDESVAPSQIGTSNGTTPTPVPEGTYAPAIIILLTDGASNTGPTPEDAAQQAADRGVRVYTIGFGTTKGSDSFPNCSGSSQQGQFPRPEEFGNGQPFSGGGFGFRRGIDEETLKNVADMTDGAYYSAESAGELEKVFHDLPITYIFHQEDMEISVAFTAFGALLAAFAIGLSLLWHFLP